MSPKVLVDGSLVFWFHSHDTLYKNRASVHVGKSSQDDFNDAKIWLEPQIEVSRPGRSLKRHELSRALEVIDHHRDYLLEQWHEYKGTRS